MIVIDRKDLKIVSEHFTYLNFIPNPDVQKLIAALALGGLMVSLAKRWGDKLSRTQDESLVYPDEQITGFGLVDWIVEKFFAFHDSILGVENRKHLPFVSTVFFFVLLANLVGIIPGVPAITNSIWINVALALIVFVYFNGYGIKTHGFLGYLRHFAGPLSGALLFIVGPIIFLAEILSTFLRPFTMNLRLYWNIKGDHILMEMVHNLLGPYAIGIASPLFILALFVSFMQAFVFGMLTMIYVLLATQGDHDHH